MAIWQYHMFLIPEEEASSYYPKDNFVPRQALDEIEWWKYRQLGIDSFEAFKDLLSQNKSWSNDIILFGDESSDCIELVVEENKIVEISIRVDLRKKYSLFINTLCEFAQKHKCLILSGELKIIAPNEIAINQDIKSNPAYADFLNLLKK